jgi:hypothetical protein
MQPVDPVVLLVATFIADAIVGGGWLLALVPLVWLIRSRRGEVLARNPTAADEPAGAVRWLLYAVALLFWPAALALSLYFFTKPETVRAGAVCAYLLLAYLTFSVVAAIGIVTAAAALAPQWFGLLLG